MDYNEIDDWQQFRSMDTLPAQAGVSRDKIGRLVAKEIVDNGFDNGSNCIAEYLSGGFVVENDGAGIAGTDEDIASLFSMRRSLRTTKTWRLLKRGALGNGLRVVAGAVCATNGSLLVATRGRKLKLIPQYNDGTTKYENIGPWDGKGTRIEITLPGLEEKDMLFWAERTIYMSTGIDYDGYTSPWWYCSESFRTHVNSSPDSLTVKEFIDKFDVTEKKAGKLAFRFSGKKLKEFTERDCNELLAELRTIKKPIKDKQLLGYGSELSDYAYAYNKGSGTFIIKPIKGYEAVIPFAAQVWGEKCHRGTSPSVMFFINKTHITGEVKMYIWNYTEKVNGKDIEKSSYCLTGCGLENTTIKVSKPEFPVNLIINIMTPHMPITSTGKEPDFSYMGDVIKSVIKPM